MDMNCICCVSGFLNLCKSEPSLCDYIDQIPDRLYLTSILYISFKKILIMSDDESKIHKICNDILTEIKNNHHLL